MAIKSPTALVLIYHSYRDPLFQNLMLGYLRTLVKSQRVSFHLITFEQKNYALTVKEMFNEKELLRQSGIYWHPLNYHGGKFIVLEKVIDLIQALILIFKLKKLTKASIIVSFTNLSASMGIICARLYRLKLLIYCYEPHSDYLVELGIWKKRSIKYKISRWIELYAGIHADFVMASTKYVIELLTKLKAKGKIVRAPVSVDENEFLFKPQGRKDIREFYGLTDKHVILYIGKFGYLYYNEEIAKLFKIVLDNIKNTFFLIVTSNKQSEIRKMLINHGLPEESFVVTGNLSYTEIKDYISASDIGLSAVPPTNSQKFRSPTKVAEYLLCGLPYITCEGISEDDIYAKKYNVGAVTRSFDKRDILECIPHIKLLLNEKKDSKRNRCREVGIKYRGKSNIDPLFNQIFKEIYFN